MHCHVQKLSRIYTIPRNSCVFKLHQSNVLIIVLIISRLMVPSCDTVVHTTDEFLCRSVETCLKFVNTCYNHYLRKSHAEFVLLGSHMVRIQVLLLVPLPSTTLRVSVIDIKVAPWASSLHARFWRVWDTLTPTKSPLPPNQFETVIPLGPPFLRPHTWTPPPPLLPPLPVPPTMTAPLGLVYTLLSAKRALCSFRTGASSPTSNFGWLWEESWLFPYSTKWFDIFYCLITFAGTSFVAHFSRFFLQTKHYLGI